MEMIWSESISQTKQMSTYFLNQSNGETFQMPEGIRAIAINVLSKASYGETKSWQPFKVPSEPELADKMSYVDALAVTCELIVLAAFVSPDMLVLSFMPKLLRTLGEAMKRLPGLTKKMLENERQLAKAGSGERANIMSMLVRLSDKGRDAGGEMETGKGQYLSEDEISGNLFFFTAAGFDTAAAAMKYGIVLLAAYPEWQDWMRDNIDAVLADKEGEELDYATLFPKLGRVLAVMVSLASILPTCRVPKYQLTLVTTTA
jgi:cytochrome P450